MTLGGQVHPAAEVWPLMSDDELEALAADIDANGLREPIRFWRGQLIDGRNRAIACMKVGVVPDVILMDDLDEEQVVAYIESANAHRRHISKGQRAVVLAKLHAPDGRWEYGRQSEILASGKDSPNAVLLSKAAYLVGSHPNLVDPVLTGAKGLNAAYDEGKQIDTEREARLDEWANKVIAALRTLSRMAGNPIPDGVAARLSEDELAALKAALEGGGLDGYDFG